MQMAASVATVKIDNILGACEWWKFLILPNEGNLGRTLSQVVALITFLFSGLHTLCEIEHCWIIWSQHRHICHTRWFINNSITKSWADWKPDCNCFRYLPSRKSGRNPSISMSGTLSKTVIHPTRNWRTNGFNTFMRSLSNGMNSSMLFSCKPSPNVNALLASMHYYFFNIECSINYFEDIFFDLIWCSKADVATHKKGKKLSALTWIDRSL